MLTERQLPEFFVTLPRPLLGRGAVAPLRSATLSTSCHKPQNVSCQKYSLFSLRAEDGGDGGVERVREICRIANFPDFFRPCRHRVFSLCSKFADSDTRFRAAGGTSPWDRPLPLENIAPWDRPLPPRVGWTNRCVQRNALDRSVWHFFVHDPVFFLSS